MTVQIVFFIINTFYYYTNLLNILIYNLIQLVLIGFNRVKIIFNQIKNNQFKGFAFINSFLNIVFKTISNSSRKRVVYNIQQTYHI